MPYRWQLIVLLWLAYFFNQADRQVYNTVLTPLQKELGLTDAQAGLVGMVFMWTYAILVPVAGYAGDALRRKWVVFGSLLFWSVSTIFSGMTTGLLGLVAFRSLATGGGEAFYYPSANSLIGQYHDKSRALAMSIHQTSAYFGIIASGFLAGWIADHWGWRSAFFIFGAFGLLLALAILVWVEDVKQASASAKPDAETAPSILEVVRAMIRVPTIWALCLAFALFNFVGWGCAQWLPAFLGDRFGLTLAAAGFASTFYLFVPAFIGVLVAGRLSDGWAARRRSARMETQVAGLFFGVPFLVLLGMTGHWWLSCLGLAGFGLARGIYDSNLFAALFDVIEPRYRASAAGLMLAMAFIGGGLGPWAFGWAKATIGLEAGIAWSAVAYVLAAAILLVASRVMLPGDYQGSEANG